jgi:arylsulfatase A-like enzyme
MRPARAEPSALQVLFTASGAVAVAVALANVVVLIRTTDVARLRDLRLVARLRLFCDAHAPALLGRWPEILHVPFDLSRTAAVVALLAGSIVVHLVMAWVAATIVAPVMLPLARRHAGGAPWRHGYPLAVVGLAASPLLAHRLSLWTTAGSAAIWAMSLGVALIAGLVAARVASASTDRRVTHTCTVVTLAGLAIALGGSAVGFVSTERADGARPLPAAGSPNVLLISIDTLRPDHLGSYGYGRDTSPTLDALAAAGARFTTVVSPTSWTLPAHMTLLTALPPEVHGVVDDGLRLDPSTVTLAEVLHDAGYVTAGFVSGPYLDAGYGFARGFDHYDDYSAVRISHPATHQAHTSPALLAAVSGWLARRSDTAARRPFFLFVHMWDVHYDFNPPPPYDTLFDPAYQGRVTGLDFETGTSVHAGMPARDLAHVIALYDGEIRYTDAYVGRLLDALRECAVFEDTLIVVTADHGEEFFEHGNKGHRNALYDESIRVPLIVRYPNAVRAGTVVDTQVRLMDVAPTILTLTHTTIPPSFGLDPTLRPYTAQTLTPLLAGGHTFPLAPPAFASLHPHALAAIRNQDTKLILTPFSTPHEQLFDLTTDPREKINQAQTDSTTTTLLKAELSKWQDTARLAAKHAQSAAMSADHKAALRALGYVE